MLDVLHLVAFSDCSDKNDTMTEGVEGCSDDPLTSLQSDVASSGPSSESQQQSESRAEVSTLCISSSAAATDDDIDKIITSEWHAGECKSMLRTNVYLTCILYACTYLL